MNKCAVLVLPTQYAAQQIKASLVNYRGWDWDSIRLVTGVDKEDRHDTWYTRLTITTYGNNLKIWICNLSTLCKSKNTTVKSMNARNINEM